VSIAKAAVIIAKAAVIIGEDAVIIAEAASGRIAEAVAKVSVAKPSAVEAKLLLLHGNGRRRRLRGRRLSGSRLRG